MVINSVSDFKVGEVVMTGLPGALRMAIVIPQPEKFKRHYTPDAYVWVKYIDDGYEDGWSPTHLRRPKEQDDG